MELKKSEKFYLETSGTKGLITISVKLKANKDKNSNFTEYPNLWNEYRLSLIELILEVLGNCITQQIPDEINMYATPEDEIFTEDIAFDIEEIIDIKSQEKKKKEKG